MISRGSVTSDGHGVRFRRREAADLPAAYRVFRRSLFDYLGRTGQIDAETAADPPIDSGWQSQRPWIEHLSGSAAEDWVAVDHDDRIIGWAQSVERDGQLELTFFFVDPSAQSKGVGRGLLERAFPSGRGPSRLIIATQEPRALRLYLSSGVRYLTSATEFVGRPTVTEVGSDLSIERAQPTGNGAVEAILELEREVLGHGRDVDVRFLLSDRPAWLARREGRVVGMAFGANGVNTGPIAALDPADLPALLLTVEREAAERGLEEVYFTAPLVNTIAVDHLLGRGFRIDPFFMLILGSSDRMRLDCWVQTLPEFIL